MFRKRLRRQLTIFCAVFIAANAAGTGLLSAEIPSAGILFRKIEERFSNINTMAYTVKRVMVTNRLTAEDRWVFRYKKPDHVRIDYLAPHERLIIIDGATLWEYIPQLKKVAKTDLTQMSMEKRDKTIAEVMAHVSVDGLHLGMYDEMEKRALPARTITWGGKDVYVIEGTAPRYVVYIDKEKSALLRTEIYDRKGGLTVRTAGSLFTEVERGFWMPREIRTTYRNPSGFVQTTVRLEDIRADTPMADDTFRFEVPKGVGVILN